MAKERRRFSGAEKLAILREHLIERVPISEVCDKHGVQPTLFYAWQKKLFEEGVMVFEQPRAKSTRRQAAEQRKIDALVVNSLACIAQSAKILGRSEGPVGGP